MGAPALEVRTEPDGTVVIRFPVTSDRIDAGQLRQLLVHTVRKVRPGQIVVDLAGVSELDPIHVGVLHAACGLGDDYRVVVFIDNTSRSIAERLSAAGVPPQRLRRIGAGPPVGDPRLPGDVENQAH